MLLPVAGIVAIRLLWFNWCNEDNSIDKVEVSKLLFGRAEQLTVWAAVEAVPKSADQVARFFVRQLCDTMGDQVAISTAWRSVETLEHLGMINRQALTSSSDRAIWFERDDTSAGWGLVRCAIELSADLQST